MAEPLHADERAIYEASLRRRVDRLASLLKLPAGSASPVVLAMFVGHVLRSAVPLCGKELTADLLTWCGRQLRETYGLCAFCGATKETAALMCPACIAEMERVDQELLLETANPRAPQ